jgi:hypothetical protein
MPIANASQDKVIFNFIAIFSYRDVQHKK